MSKKKGLLIVGSLKKDGASYSLGQYLTGRIGMMGYDFSTLYIGDAVKDKDSMDAMVRAFNDSDAIILSYPLYIDSLPALCIKAMEYITKERAKEKQDREQSFLAIGNCGFYELEQIKGSINICRFFAEDNGLKWLGGVCVGGGPVYQRKDLVLLGGEARNLRLALDMAVKSILDKAELDACKVDSLTSPPISGTQYFISANMGFWNAARKNKQLKLVGRRPYTL